MCVHVPVFILNENCLETRFLSLFTGILFADVVGRWVFEVANFGADNQAAQACLQWYNIQKFYMFPIGLTEDLGIACPCNVANAAIDENYIFDYNAYCAYSLYRKLTTGYFQVIHFSVDLYLV